jgi:hypothetical protein
LFGFAIHRTDHNANEYWLRGYNLQPTHSAPGSLVSTQEHPVRFHWGATAKPSTRYIYKIVPM